MIQDKIFFDEKDPTGLSYNTPFTFYGSYQGRLWSKSPSGSIQYYTQNSDLSAYATTGSNQFSGSQTVTGSLTVTGTITGTVAGTTATASYVEYTNVANKPALISGSAQIASFGIFATTGSNGFNGSQSITGSLTVTGQVVAQTLNVQQVTSSIVYSSGSNVFGNSLSNTQQFTGSVGVTGSLTVAGAGTFSGNVTLSGTNSQLLQTISNSIAGDNAAVLYNSNANSYGLYIGAGSGTNHALYITDSTRTKDLFKVQGNGNVGIGTSTPDVTGFGWRTLTIRGGTTSGEAGVLELQSPTTTGAANLGIIAFLDGSTRGGQIYVQRDSSTTTSNMLFATNGGSGIVERMRITSGGEVNIGGFATVFPVLTVKGIASGPHIGSTWSVSANQDGTGRTIIATAGQGRSMYFENNGDIVIPNNRLEVSGTGHISTFTHVPLFHGRKLLLYGPTSSTTINLVTEFPLIGLVTGNVWAVFGKYCGLASGGGSEAREFYISRNTSGTWSGAEYGPTANTGGSLSSIGGSGTNLVIGTTANAYFGLELTVMIR